MASQKGTGSTGTYSLFDQSVPSAPSPSATFWRLVAGFVGHVLLEAPPACVFVA